MDPQARREDSYYIRYRALDTLTGAQVYRLHQLTDRDADPVQALQI